MGGGGGGGGQNDTDHKEKTLNTDLSEAMREDRDDAEQMTAKYLEEPTDLNPYLLSSVQRSAMVLL